MKPMLRRLLSLGTLSAIAAQAAFGLATVEHVRSTGQVSCGIVASPEDWNKTDLHGPLMALDSEICKAVAVAALGPRFKLDVNAFDSELEAEESLSRGGVDLVVGVSPDATSMWHWNIAFGPPVFFDGQGLLVRGDASVRSLADLAGMKVCVVEVPAEFVTVSVTV